MKDLTLSSKTKLLKEIDALLSSQFKNEPTGFLGGKEGIILFRYLYEKTLQIKKSRLGNLIQLGLEDILKHSIQSVDSYLALSLSVYEKLINEGVINEEDISEVLDYFSDRFIQNIDVLIQENNWDPLHGYVGYGFYFLERAKRTGDTSAIERIISALWDNKKQKGDGIVWTTNAYSYEGIDSPEVYNFGMAHGMPGIIGFISQCTELLPADSRIYTMISGYIQFILKYYKPDSVRSLFPQRVLVSTDMEEIPPSDLRLAWCYGDTGVINSILLAGKSCKNEEWINLSLRLMQQFIENIKTEDLTFKDAGVCHGHFGAIHLLFQYRSYIDPSKIDSMINTLYHNAMETQYYKHGDLSPFYCFEIDEHKTDFGFLSGLAGIGLVLLDTIEPTHSNWKNILNTHIDA